MSRSMLDSAGGGAFMSKTVSEAKAILESMLQNYTQWHTERAPTSSTRKVNSVEEVDSLTAKVDQLLALMSKNNVENVPIQDLVGNNAESIDVNYIRNFGNNGYGNNYNSNAYARPPFVPNKYTSGNAISNDLENTIRSFIASQKELNKEFIAKNEKFDALFDNVDRLTKEVISLKNFVQPQRNHEETIKYVQDVIDKSWETIRKWDASIAMNNMQEETTMLMENNETTKIEELKMLNDVVTEPLLDLDKCSLSELIIILQKIAKDPSINANQAGFGSYIANHVLKEKIDRYNKESMIPPKLGDLWTPKIQITIGKVTWHAILDLGSSVSALSKDLYTMLELPTMEKCNVDLLLADDSTKHALGRVDNVMVEFNMTFVPVDFIIMDMGSKSSNSIILGSTTRKHGYSRRLIWTA